jgi:hypothetical protein
MAAPASSPPPSSPSAAPGPPPGSAAEQEPAPVIDEITVEKPEVCAGEENLITVRAHTPNGTDAFLHYAVGRTQGRSVPLRIWPEPDGSYEKPTISVFGRNNVATRVEVPPYRVKDCKPARNAVIAARLSANTEAEYEFAAKIVEVGAKDDPKAKPFKPVSYRWRFGDGATKTTTEARAVHSYEERPQETFVSDYLVEVEVRSESGDKLVGRAALELLNTIFENYAQRGIVTIMATPTPRFPELGSDGRVHQSFRLWHHRDAPVRIKKLFAVRHYIETSDNSPPESVDVGSTLGSGEIPPGHGADVDIVLDTQSEPDVFTITYSLEGETAEGAPARGSFSLMRPPPKPTKESSTPVLDPGMVAKIQRARKLLGQEFVTDEDIWRLEREGKMDDLKVEPSPAAAAPVAPVASSPVSRKSGGAPPSPRR